MNHRWLLAILLLVAAASMPIDARRSDRGDRGVVPDILSVEDLELLAEGLLSPTDVAVSNEGTIYVVDGFAGLIHVYGPQGDEQEPLQVGGQPVGIGWGAGRLWVPRTDRPSVMVYDPALAQWEERAVDGPAEGTRLTDAAISSHRLVVASNEGGPWVSPLNGGAWTELEIEPRAGMGFLLAADAGKRIVLGDVKEDQVLLLDIRKDERFDLGHWGVWEGCFLHPTGVAIDERGRIFVADGFLGVIQAYNEDGEFLGALGSGTDLLRLDHPMGLDFGGDRLYALDWSAGRVYSMRLSARTQPEGRTGLYSRKVPRISYLEGAHTPSQLLVPVCQSCHDGSVRDSAPVWNPALSHHPVDVVSEKPIPEPFTLDDNGKMYCGTCHIPHRMGPEEGDEDSSVEEEVFLKEPRARSALCIACHTDVVAEVRGLAPGDGAASGGHIVGEIQSESPRAGHTAIATDVTTVECLDCHSPHGAVGKSLMSRDAAGGGGCARCHTGVAPARGGRTHSVGLPVKDEEAVRVLREREVFLGLDDEVSCLTCHDIHSSGEQSWLTAKLSDNERCILCHRHQARLQGGRHDLRKGHSGHVATACLACHTLHDATGPALGRMGGDDRDPTGCLSCHRRGGSASRTISGDAGHVMFEPNPAPNLLPSVARSGSLAGGAPGNMGCLTCHDPHGGVAAADNDKLLRLAGGNAPGCLACHPEYVALVGSDHDLRTTSSTRSNRLRGRMNVGGTCLACHGMHRGGGWRDWDAPLGGSADVSMASRTCLGCHQSGNDAGATVVRTWGHPEDLNLTTAKVPWHNTGELPLFDARGRKTHDTELGQITCLTCHDPHIWSPKRQGAGGEGEGDIRTSFLRKGWEGFCSGCHGDEALAVYRYYHDAGQRASMRDRGDRRDWPIYEEENP